MIFWDGRVKRYRDDRGRFVATGDVQRQVVKIQSQVERDVRALAAELSEGRLTVAEWQKAMREKLSAAHTLAGAIGRGGKSQMTKADWGKIGGFLKKEFGYLNRFAKLIETGKISSPEQIANRASLYASAVKKTYYRNEMESQIEGGRDEAKLEVHSREGCSECLADSGRWMPIEEMKPIGTRICGQYCKCSIIYRKAPKKQ